MARLIGVSAAVHVGEIEVADRPAGMRVPDEAADRVSAPDVGNEDASTVAPDRMGDVFRISGAVFEEAGVELVGLGGTVGGEVGEVEDEAGAEVRLQPIFGR